MSNYFMKMDVEGKMFTEIFMVNIIVRLKAPLKELLNDVVQ